MRCFRRALFVAFLFMASLAFCPDKPEPDFSAEPYQIVVASISLDNTATHPEDIVVVPLQTDQVFASEEFASPRSTGILQKLGNGTQKIIHADVAKNDLLKSDNMTSPSQRLL